MPKLNLLIFIKMTKRSFSWQILIVSLSCFLVNCTKKAIIIEPSNMLATTFVPLSAAQPRMPFNVFTFQTCRENGLKVRHVPSLDKISDYIYSFESLDKIPLTTSQNSFVLLNNDGKTGSVKSTILRNGVTWTETLKHSTCNHDKEPIDCPENTNSLIISNLRPVLYDVITIKWNGILQKDQILNHFGEGYILVQDVNETTIRIKIMATFFHIQMQPTVSIYSGCHGWSAFSGNVLE
jgi:hypothetical protein